MEEACWELFADTGQPVFYLLYCRERDRSEIARSAWGESAMEADPA